MPEPRPRALSEAERTELRAGLNSEEYLDETPATKLLDEGLYLASAPTTYRVPRETTATTVIIWIHRS